MILAKKVDYDEMLKILEQKVDSTAFTNLVRNVDFKADRLELQKISSQTEDHPSSDEVSKLYDIVQS